MVLGTLMGFTGTVMVLSNSSLFGLYHGANLAHFNAMTATREGRDRYFVFTSDPQAIEHFAAQQFQVSLISDTLLSDIGVNAGSNTVELEIDIGDATILQRLRDLPATDLIVNASAAFLCR